MKHSKIAPCRQVIGRRMKPCPRGGKVYFVGSDRGMIKIGWTQQDLSVRLAALQNGNPERLSILASVDGSHALESAYHSRFACLRHTGEWFVRSKALMDEIDRLNRRAESNETVRRGGKLTESDVLEIRHNGQGLKANRLAAKYGVSRVTVWKIQNGKAWTDLPTPTKRPSA